MTPTLRDSTTLGRYRIEVWQEAIGLRVEVHELGARGGWTLSCGPYAYSDLFAALLFAHDVAERLREREGRET